MAKHSQEQVSEQVKWYKRKGVRIIALITALTLVGGELGARFIYHVSEQKQIQEATLQFSEEEYAFLTNPQNLRGLFNEIMTTQREQEELYELTVTAQNYLNEENYEKALESVDAILDHPQISTEFYEQMQEVKLVLSFYLGKMDETIILCDEMIQSDEFSEVPDLYLYRGICYLSEEDYEQAYVDFNAAINYGADTSNVYYNRAVSALGMDEVDEAKEDLNTVLLKNDDEELSQAAEELMKVL